jgi:hypothetical protein
MLTNKSLQNKVFLIFSLIFLFHLQMYPQIGGTSTFRFLDLPFSSKQAAMGGRVVSLRENDPSFIFANPASYDSTSTRTLLLNYSSIPGGIKFGSFASIFHFSKIGTFSAGISYINYGEFIAANELGQKTGTFSAADYVLQISCSRTIIDTFLNASVSLKPIYSNLETYTSVGLAADIGLFYHLPSHLFSAGLMIRNLGSQLKTYTTDNYEPLPFDVQLGITKRLAHAPFRFTLTLHHLNKWDLGYEKISSANSALTTENNAKDGFGDKIMRHVNIAAEFVPSKNFYFALGYDYKRRQEMKIDEKPGMVGFSWGFGLKISKFGISYSRASQHIAGADNLFTITTNLKEFIRKK